MLILFKWKLIKNHDKLICYDSFIAYEMQKMTFKKFCHNVNMQLSVVPCVEHFKNNKEFD